MSVLRRDYLPDAFKPLLRQIGFNGSIAVQARRTHAETKWLLELAGKHQFVQGVVGWVDFESNELDERLERYSLNPRFKGVRELIHDMEDPDYVTSGTHVRGVSKLAKFDLTYDLLLKPPHIRPAIELVHHLPDQRFIVDHIAKPDIARARRSPWREDFVALAEFENVFCKLSGMVTEATWDIWQPSEFRPYLDIALNAFGAERLMIGSDWPVCTLSGNYVDVMGIVIEYADSLSRGERENILGETCARCYCVEDSAIVSQKDGV